MCIRDRDNAIMMDGGGSTCFMDSAGEGFTGDGRVIPFFLVWQKKSGDAYEPEGEKPMVEINAYSKAKDGGKKLSTNFTVKEFACKDGSDAVLVAPRLSLIHIFRHLSFQLGRDVRKLPRFPGLGVFRLHADLARVQHSHHFLISFR